MRTESLAPSAPTPAPSSPLPAAAAPGQPEVFQLAREKETPNAVRFQETPAEGQPPVFGSLYLPKWKVGGAAGIALVLLPGASSPVPANAAHVGTLTRTKETPNKVVFTEAPAPGTPPVFGAVYLPKWKVGNAQSITLALVLG